jgi:hypothetical protein
MNQTNKPTIMYGVAAGLFDSLHAYKTPDTLCLTLFALQAALNPSLYKQSTNRVFMVAPTAFTYNAQAAEDNWYMSHGGLGGPGATGSMLTQKVSEWG